jgi:hypothetical protein
LVQKRADPEMKINTLFWVILPLNPPPEGEMRQAIEAQISSPFGRGLRRRILVLVKNPIAKSNLDCCSALHNLFICLTLICVRSKEKSLRSRLQ